MEKDDLQLGNDATQLVFYYSRENLILLDLDL